MQLLYVVELELEHHTGRPFEQGLEHLASWLSRGSSTAVSVEQLKQDGASRLPPVRVGDDLVTDRYGRWGVLNAPEARAVRAEITQPLSSGVELTSRVTLSDTPAGVRLRVGISQRNTGGALTPVAQTLIYQPSVLESAARDESLTLLVGGQAIDLACAQVTTRIGASEVATALRWPQRLPILLVHARSRETFRVARYLARKLIGLVRVVLVGHMGAEMISADIASARIPFSGARLVWSDVSTPGPALTPNLLVDEQGETARAFLMERLAPVSALTRGIDRGWRDVRQRALASLALDAEVRAAEARQDADSDAKAVVEAQADEITTLRRQLTEAELLASAYADEAEALRSDAEARQAAEIDARYWREQFESSQMRIPDTAGVDPWAEVPILEPRSDPSDTFLALVDAAEGRIVFTDAARRSWKKVNYPEPEDMTRNLVILAKAAVALYNGEDRTMGHLDDWFRVEWDLTVSMNDDTIERSKGLRFFDFEGERRDQTPHVKVRDGVKPNEVGRIHFALDSAGKRLIVNHVALKLYRT